MPQYKYYSSYFCVFSACCILFLGLYLLFPLQMLVVVIILGLCCYIFFTLAFFFFLLFPLRTCSFLFIFTYSSMHYFLILCTLFICVFFTFIWKFVFFVLICYNFSSFILWFIFFYNFCVIFSQNHYTFLDLVWNFSQKKLHLTQTHTNTHTLITAFNEKDSWNFTNFILLFNKIFIKILIYIHKYVCILLLLFKQN